MKFDEFFVGQMIEAGPVTVSEDEILSFARTHDPQWFHADPEAAGRGPFGTVIASGWHTCAIAMRLVAQAALDGSEAVASPGIAYVKWPHPVRPGDVLKLRADVLEVRRSNRREKLGILRWRWRLFNQHAQEALDLQATTLFDLAQ